MLDRMPGGAGEEGDRPGGAGRERDKSQNPTPDVPVGTGSCLTGDSGVDEEAFGTLMRIQVCVCVCVQYVCVSVSCCGLGVLLGGLE